MKNAPENNDPLAALQHLTLNDVRQRIADIDSERAALSVLRRSLAARERAKEKASRLNGGRDD